jgi:hypothetical protein
VDRAEDEVRTGLELLRLADGLTDVEHQDALCFAIDLLSEKHKAAWVAKLKL